MAWRGPCHKGHRGVACADPAWVAALVVSLVVAFDIVASWATRHAALATGQHGLCFEAPGMPGQAVVRQRPLSGELLASEDEGAWLPDPIASEAMRHIGGPEAAEARLFGWGELLGTWVEHLMTAIDIAVLGDRTPTVLALADRNCPKCRQQVEALRRFKCGLREHARVFVLYSHEFDWLFEAWDLREFPTLLLFGTEGAEPRATLVGPMQPEDIAAAFAEELAVDFSWADFAPAVPVDDNSLLHRLWRAAWKASARFLGRSAAGVAARDAIGVGGHG